MGPARVCRSWRRAARDDPALWRRIDMRGHADLHRRVDLCGMARAAVRSAKGRCEAFWAEYAADDGVLQLLVEQAPSLKSLRLISCQDIIRFEEEIKKLPLLEELEISLFTNIGGKHVFEAVGKACPELKHVRFNSYRFINLGNREHSDDEDYYYDYDDNDLKYKKDDDALGIASMHGLCTLQLFGNSLTNEGLRAIFDNCPHLESLDIRHCFNITMDDTLQAKCARIKTLKLPYDSTDDYGFPVCSPLLSVGIYSDSDTLGSFGIYSDSDDCDYGDYILDSDDYDGYCDPFRYLNGVYEAELGPEDRMFLKGMRMLLRDDDDDDY
ncbi:putative F-box/LRR-repeat protein 22 [Panicum miliaceum]|uniref:F-box/LRR-repeat protein 22 n=1 Tax=Panicum miliaceum TaxID=4540 RepID=A0A3L6PR14_PANMI|nr:putative F-box/LRR-repeat protein 22 [Panicum miliaceum]